MIADIAAILHLVGNVSADLIARYPTPKAFFDAPLETPTDPTSDHAPWFATTRIDERGKEVVIQAFAGIGALEFSVEDGRLFVLVIAYKGPGVEARKAWLIDAVTRIRPDAQIVNLPRGRVEA